MGILKILFSLFILSFPFAEIGRLQFYNGIAIMFNDVLLMITFFTWVILKIKNKDIKLKGMLIKPLIIFIGICFLSLILNLKYLSMQNFLVSFLYLVRFVLYSSLYFIVFDFSKSTRKQIPYLMLISGFLFVLEGYVQYFLYPSLRNLFYLGWDEHLYRMFSGFLDPNFAGAFFVLFFVFSLSFIIPEIKKKNKNYLYLTLYMAISGLSLFAVFLSYSRSALLMLVFSIIVFLVLINKKKFIIFSIILILVLVVLAPKSFSTEGTNIFREVSSQARIKSAQQGIYMFEKNPVFGVGFNAYRYAQNRYLGLNNSVWQITHSGAGTDNSFVFVLVTTGFVGLISYLYLIYKILKISKGKIHKNNLSIVLFSVVIGLIGNSLFVNSLFYIFILEWMFILVSLTENS